MSGEPIPVLGFGVLTLVFSMVGLLLAAMLAARPVTHAGNETERAFLESRRSLLDPPWSGLGRGHANGQSGDG